MGFLQYLFGKPKAKDIVTKNDIKRSTWLAAIIKQHHNVERAGGQTPFSGVYSKEPSPNEQLKINDKLNFFLTTLNKDGVVSPQTYKEAGNRINKNKYRSPLEMLDDLICIETNIEWLNLTDVLSYFDGLKNNGIVSDASCKRLAADIKKNLIFSSIQLVDYYEKAVSIDLEGYIPNPNIYLETIHRDVAALLPELAFTDFSFTEELDAKNSSDYMTFYNYIVTLKCNGKLYKQKSTSRIVNNEERLPVAPKCSIEIQVFYQLFNKILAENQSPYRLHTVFSNDQIRTRVNPFGIIALTQAQAEFIRPKYNAGTINTKRAYLSITEENYKANITDNSIEKAISEWEKLGLFKHLPAEEIAQAKAVAYATAADDFNTLLMQFPNVIYSYDAEFGNLDNPYEEILLNLAAISHNQFNPTDIVDGFANPDEDDMFTLLFNWNGKPYTIEMLIEGDWLDEEFFININKILKENNSSGLFYDLKNNGQIGSVIYLTPETQHYLKSNNLLVF